MTHAVAFGIVIATKDLSMSTDESRNWQKVERRAVSLIDKGHLLQRQEQNEAALAAFDKAVTICRPIAGRSDSAALVMAQYPQAGEAAAVLLERAAAALATEPDARIQVWARACGYQDGSGVGQVVRRLEQRSVQDVELRRKLERIKANLSRIQS